MIDKNEIKKALAFRRLQLQQGLQFRQSSTPEEIVELYRDGRFKDTSEAILTTTAKETLAQHCPVCSRTLEEHSEEELIQCIRTPE